MTGIYLQVRRGGKRVSVEIEHLTAEELAQLERDKPLDGWRWVAAITKWIRERVRVRLEDVDLRAIDEEVV